MFPRESQPGWQAATRGQTDSCRSGPLSPATDEVWWVWECGPTPASENMAWDEALLWSVLDLGRPVLRFYAWSEPAASFGYFQQYSDVLQRTSLRPLVRRPTGGGLVLHQADWTYAVAIPPGHEWYKLRAEASYQRVHTWVRAALERLGLPTHLAPEPRTVQPGCCFEGHERYDLLWQGRKVAGAAQRRTRTGLLIQGSVQPPASLAGMRPAWHRAMQAVAQLNWRVDWQPFVPPSAVAATMQTLLESKYSRPEYHQRR